MKYVLVGSGQFSEKSNFKKYAKKCKVIALVLTTVDKIT